MHDDYNNDLTSIMNESLYFLDIIWNENSHPWLIENNVIIVLMIRHQMCKEEVRLISGQQVSFNLHKIFQQSLCDCVWKSISH